MHFINVSIIYALPEKVWVKELNVRRGSTPTDIVELSGFLNDFPEFEMAELKFGVYSKVVDQNYLMTNLDRLEIYRPLKADPKSVRRELAKVGKTMTDKRD